MLLIKLNKAHSVPTSSGKIKSDVIDLNRGVELAVLNYLRKVLRPDRKSSLLNATALGTRHTLDSIRKEVEDNFIEESPYLKTLNTLGLEVRESYSNFHIKIQVPNRNKFKAVVRYLYGLQRKFCINRVPCKIYMEVDHIDPDYALFIMFSIIDKVIPIDLKTASFLKFWNLTSEKARMNMYDHMSPPDQKVVHTGHPVYRIDTPSDIHNISFKEVGKHDPTKIGDLVDKISSSVSVPAETLLYVREFLKILKTLSRININESIESFYIA